jgi:hypothetical protein
MYLPFYLEFPFLLSLISTATSSWVSHDPCLPLLRCRLGRGWTYLRCQCAPPAKAKICQNRTFRFGKLDTQVFPITSDCTSDGLSSSHAGKSRRGSLVILSEELMCSCIYWKVCEHIVGWVSWIIELVFRRWKIAKLIGMNITVMPMWCCLLGNRKRRYNKMCIAITLKLHVVWEQVFNVNWWHSVIEQMGQKSQLPFNAREDELAALCQKRAARIKQ